MKIGIREIGGGQPAYIIAEMSANHAGDISRAKEIIHAAKEAGADCISFIRKPIHRGNGRKNCLRKQKKQKLIFFLLHLTIHPLTFWKKSALDFTKLHLLNWWIFH